MLLKQQSFKNEPLVYFPIKGQQIDDLKNYLILLLLFVSVVSQTPENDFRLEYLCENLTKFKIILDYL